MYSMQSHRKSNRKVGSRRKGGRRVAVVMLSGGRGRDYDPKEEGGIWDVKRTRSRGWIILFGLQMEQSPPALPAT